MVEPIDEGIVTSFGGLLDPREIVEFAIPGTFESPYAKGPAWPIGLLVTNQRIVVGGLAPEGKEKGQARPLGLRNRRQRLAPTDMDGRLKVSFGHFLFDTGYLELMNQIDQGAAAWDQLTHPSLGTLTADELGNYCLDNPAEGLTNLRVDPDGVLPEDAMGWAAEAVANLDTHLAAAWTTIMGQYLPLKNESWLGDGEDPVSEADFRRRLTLTNIEVQSDALLTFFFADDNMFGGHSVVATSFDKGQAWDLQLFG